MKENRKLSFAKTIQEGSQALRSVRLNLALGSDPFAAASTACIVIALGEIEDHRGRFRSGLGFLRVRALRLGSNRSGKRHHDCSKKGSYKSHKRTIGLHWQTPLANRNLKQRKHQSAHIYAASNRAGQQICDRANRYCTCIAAQLSEPVSPLQLDEVVAAFGNMAPA